MVAIYARKSLFKEDSISTKSQIEMCEFEARGEKYQTYIDNGYSGKNTERPGFQQMMQEIKEGRINKVIVYKLDRISRSILDFSEMMQTFQEYGVDFVSATEHFDTSSPMGRAMLNICIVFAQLDRETIQQRTADAFASRSKKGFFMGGKTPFGFNKEPINIGGVNTSMLVTNQAETEIVQFAFKRYAQNGVALGDVIREIRQKDLSNVRHKSWTNSHLSQLLRNPAYVQADYNVYLFFKEQGAIVQNDPAEFDGRGLYIFQGDNTNRKTWDLSNQVVVVAPHQGIVDANTWLTCRNKILANHKVKSTKVKTSFLVGKVKCGYCGSNFAVIKSKTKAGRYFIDTGRRDHKCDFKHNTLYVDEIEQLITDQIKTKLKDLNLSLTPPKQDNSKKIVELQVKVESINREINKFVEKVVFAEGAAIRYINEHIAELDEQKSNLELEIEKLKNPIKQDKKKQVNELIDVMKVWDRMTFEDKRAVIELLIDKIEIKDDCMTTVFTV